METLCTQTLFPKECITLAPLVYLYVSMTTSLSLKLKPLQQGWATLFGSRATLETNLVYAGHNDVLNLNVATTRPVLDRFQDSSKTGSGINCFPTFLATIFFFIFCNLFCRLFLLHFFPPFFLPFCQLFLACFFEYAVQMTFF